MAINAQQVFTVSLQTAADMIEAGGSQNTVLLQGHMGWGKTSILKILKARLPNHKCFYFDCTTKDLGDLALPAIGESNGVKYSEMVPNWELGLHEDGPVIIMFDEWGKANPSVKLGTLAFMLERRFGNRTLHPDSIVFATTNLAGENVGDMLPPHARNRLTVLNMRKPTNMEWIENFGIPAGLHPSILGWCKDNPQLFDDFQLLKDPTDNPYIYHPRSTETAFVTGRSLEKASNWVYLTEKLGMTAVKSALIGTIGARGALDLMAFVELADQMPRLDDIKTKPETAVVPKSPAAVCMTVFRALSVIDGTWLDAWMTYMSRLDLEAQAMFANGVRSANYNKDKQALVMTNKAFGAFAIANNHLYTADAK